MRLTALTLARCSNSSLYSSLYSSLFTLHAAGHSGSKRGPSHRLGNHRRDRFVEHTRDNVLLVELVFSHAVGNGPSRRHLHLVIDHPGAAVEQPPKEPRKTKHIIYLFFII